jgi:hypothetical protein
MLAVSPSAQGRGVGAALVGACRDLAIQVGASAIIICTRDFALAALRLYARLGFVRVPERDWSMLPGGEPARAPTGPHVTVGSGVGVPLNHRPHPARHDPRRSAQDREHGVAGVEVSHPIIQRTTAPISRPSGPEKGRGGVSRAGRRLRCAYDGRSRLTRWPRRRRPPPIER